MSDRELPYFDRVVPYHYGTRGTIRLQGCASGPAALAKLRNAARPGETLAAWLDPGHWQTLSAAIHLE